MTLKMTNADRRADSLLLAVTAYCMMDQNWGARTGVVRDDVQQEHRSFARGIGQCISQQH